MLAAACAPWQEDGSLAAAVRTVDERMCMVRSAATWQPVGGPASKSFYWRII